MKVSVRVEADKGRSKLEDSIRERIDAAMERFGDRVAGVQVHAWEEGHRHSGNEHRCDVNVTLVSRGTIHVGASGTSTFNAAVEAIDRAERALTTSIEKRRSSHEVRHEHGGLRHLSEQLDAMHSDESA